jgi:hypothetical protein
MNRNEILHDPRHLGVLLGASKWFLSLRYVWCKPGTYHAPKLTLSRKEPKGDSTWPTSPRSSIGCVQNDFWGYATFGANCGSILHRDLHYVRIDWNKIQHDPRHLGVALGASKTISELTVHSAQTVQLSYTKISTVSKRTEMSFHLSLVTRSTIRCIQNNFWAYGTYGTNYAPIMHGN